MKVKVYEHHKPQLLATRKGAFFPSDAMNTHYSLFQQLFRLLLHPKSLISKNVARHRFTPSFSFDSRHKEQITSVSRWKQLYNNPLNYFARPNEMFVGCELKHLLERYSVTWWILLRAASHLFSEWEKVPLSVYFTTGAVYKSSFGFRSGITNKSDATAIRVPNIYFKIKFCCTKSERISEAEGLNYF